MEKSNPYRKEGRKEEKHFIPLRLVEHDRQEETKEEWGGGGLTREGPEHVVRGRVGSPEDRRAETGVTARYRWRGCTPRKDANMRWTARWTRQRLSKRLFDRGIASR